MKKVEIILNIVAKNLKNSWAEEYQTSLDNKEVDNKR
jgi:hypothetical protein